MQNLELPQLDILVLVKSPFIQQILDEWDPPVDVETQPTVNINPLNDEENDRTHKTFDLPTGSGQGQSSGRSGTGHITPRSQQGQR
ncbi:hypothetical protein HYPSUDRAFT_203648 [Hypholoma sublateritium FD-334 SS-4]|uniref:Uncharacterized protein n=1 Tax=Hypholoma sublateritium (strain FD-334 SS-4) TaxID=945553 RepID=A0A0D2NPI7_HYPSF|nr:hypothetical protein HYPSUDRAFT_203648 [Hypholoma sublateritium FD-334 SS-4]